MKQNIMAYNKYMTFDYLDRMHPVQLLRLVHPLDRIRFAEMLKDDGWLESKDLKPIRQTVETWGHVVASAFAKKVWENINAGINM